MRYASLAIETLHVNSFVNGLSQHSKETIYRLRSGKLGTGKCLAAFRSWRYNDDQELIKKCAVDTARMLKVEFYAIVDRRNN